MEITESPSILLQGMSGSVLPVVISHGEGRASYADAADLAAVQAQNKVALRYVNAAHQATETYPQNPNGTPLGLNGFTTTDGRVLIMMPHPERVFRNELFFVETCGLGAVEHVSVDAVVPKRAQVGGIMPRGRLFG